MRAFFGLFDYQDLVLGPTLLLALSLGHLGGYMGALHKQVGHAWPEGSEANRAKRRRGTTGPHALEDTTLAKGKQ
jgi:hypothetical protein